VKKTKPYALWLKWTIKPLLIIAALMLGVFLMTYVGGWVFESQQAVLSFGAALNDWFWALFALRVAMYAALYWKSELIFGWLIGRNNLKDIDFTASNYRHMLLRVVIVYELIFPFDVIGRLNAGGF